MRPLLIYVNTRGKLDELEHEKGAYYCRKEVDDKMAKMRPVIDAVCRVGLGLILDDDARKAITAFKALQEMEDL